MGVDQNLRLLCTTVNMLFALGKLMVKIKRTVMVPYRHEDGQPKDGDETANGNDRLTHPSNLWTDITLPFWSMPGNTDHPTQKPEELIAKLVLASSRPGELILDPFLGSGTSAVVAQKRGRHFYGIELNQEYCCWARRRLELATADARIQAYADGIFWERNSLALSDQKSERELQNNGHVRCT